MKIVSVNMIPFNSQSDLIRLRVKENFLFFFSKEVSYSGTTSVFDFDSIVWKAQDGRVIDEPKSSELTKLFLTTSLRPSSPPDINSFE